MSPFMLSETSSLVVRYIIFRRPHMKDLNLCIFTGRLTRNAETFVSKNGNPVTKFSLAVSDDKRTKDPSTGAVSYVDDVAYIDFVYFGNNAQTVSPYLTKGRELKVVTKAVPSKQTWTDAQTGEEKTRISVDFIVDELILGAKPQNTQQAPAPQNPAQPQYAQPAPQNPAQPQYANPAPQNQNYARPAQNYRQPAQPQYAQPAPQAPAQNVLNNFGGNPEDNIPF